uniref:Tyrosine transaminase n=1 Tax=Strigomonas oncopelti TaxID=5657 RepID=T1YSS9_STROO|nr:tyrosine transaminase [Strigomonas oncopelti]AGU68005.1 tyrosine transaminase [Strigomonas oncopelti]
MPAEWNIAQSDLSARVINPIRHIADSTKPSACGKSCIKLSLGDPTLDGNLRPSEETVQAVLDAAQSHEHDGYGSVVGIPAARESVAAHWRDHFVTSDAARAHVTASNVVFSSGGSHAIAMSVAAVCNPGDNIIVPAPGFPTYDTAGNTYQAEIRRYHLDSHNGWEANLAELEGLVDERTKLVIMTNPSNPCGSNYSRKHVTDMVKLCERLRVPLLSDEIYAGIVYQYAENPNKDFVSVADVESDGVRLVLGGTAKLHTVPGWRVAWLLLIDPAKVAGGYYKGLEAQATLVLGPNTLVQAALPGALQHTPKAHFERIVATLEAGAMQFYHAIKERAVRTTDGAPLLIPTLPQGAMYVMVEIALDHFDAAAVATDVQFYQKLNEEENVLVMPGSIFHADGFFRAVTTRPPEILAEAIDRIIAFCQRNEKK